MQLLRDRRSGNHRTSRTIAESRRTVDGIGGITPRRTQSFRTAARNYAPLPWDFGLGIWDF
jgi:hypothetical protein